MQEYTDAHSQRGGGGGGGGGGSKTRTGRPVGQAVGVEEQGGVGVEEQD